jgi:type VI secretion system secreted protein Hcp
MKKIVSLTLLLASAVFSNINAQDIFLKALAPSGGSYGGLINGGSNKDGHQNEIEVLSYSQGMASCAPNFNGGGGQACKPSIGSLTLMMRLSPGLNQLKYFLLTGLHLVSGDFVFEKPGNDNSFVYYRIRMEDIAVVSIQESSSGSETPTISVELAASKIAWAIYTQDPTGNTTPPTKLGYNLATNTIWNYNF